MLSFGVFLNGVKIDSEISVQSDFQQNKKTLLPRPKKTHTPPKTKSNHQTSEPKTIYIAKYPYSSTRQDELTFIKNEKIELITRITEEDGWWRGKLLSNGKIGVFPANYMRSKKGKS